MRVRAKKLRTFDADSPITKSGAFGGAGNYTNVVEHKSPVRDDRSDAPFRSVVEELPIIPGDYGPGHRNEQSKKDRVFRNEQVGLIA